MKRANIFTRDDVVRANTALMSTDARTDAKGNIRVFVTKVGDKVFSVKTRTVKATPVAKKTAVKLTTKEINNAYAEARKLISST